MRFAKYSPSTKRQQAERCGNSRGKDLVAVTRQTVGKKYSSNHCEEQEIHDTVLPIALKSREHLLSTQRCQERHMDQTASQPRKSIAEANEYEP